MIPEAAGPRTGSARAEALDWAESLSAFVAVVEAGEVVHVNRAGCALLGRRLRDLVGRPIDELLHADDRGAVERAGARLDARFRCGDGSTVRLRCAVDPFPPAGRAATLLIGLESPQARDEQALARSEAQLAAAQRIGQIGSWEWDIARGRITWSDEMCRIFGTEPSAFGSEPDGYFALLHPDDRARAREVIGEALRTAGEFAFEHRVLHSDGSVRTLTGRGKVFLDPSGRPVRMAGTGQDITERKRMEEELRRSEERFRGLCMQAPVMLMSFDPNGLIRDVSQFWLQTMGYERGEVVGRVGFDFVTPETHERLLKTVEEKHLSGVPVMNNVPVRAVKKDGSTVDLLCTSVTEIGDAGEEKGSICVQINLTDLQRAEDALRESEERYRALVEHAPEAIMVLDVDMGLFVDANARAEELFGYPRERILAMGPLDFCTEEQSNGRPSCDVIEDEHRRVLEGETPVFEFTHVDAQGREIHCQTRLSRLPALGRRLIRASTTDISELKELQARMRHADRLAAVGALAAGVAHEIGNPLMALSMAAQSLERRTCDDYTQLKLGLIREHSERISRIVRQMSELARPQIRARERCDVNGIVRRAVDMVRYDKRAHGAEVRYELVDELPPVLAAEDELTQVCVNLALNAFDAMAANPEARARVLTIRSVATESHVRVSFADTGHGVPEPVRARLFDPFFTTKEAGRGTGLGLSVSYRILEEHQGALALDEDAEGGATFVFQLPRIEAS